MSLINKMLRDLDARQAPSVDRASLPGTLHPLPPEIASPVGRIILGGLMLVAAGAWFLVAPHGEPVAVPPPVAAVAVLPPSAPPSAPPAAPEAPKAEAAPVEPVPEPKPELPVPDAPKQPELPKPELPKPAAPKPEIPKAAPAPKAATPLEARSQRESAPSPKLHPETQLPGSKESVSPAKAVGTVIDAAPAAIDRRSRTASTSDGAEMEYRRGMAALRRGAAAEAFEALRAALKTEPRHVSARQALLSVMVEQQQWNDALALVEEGLALDPAQVGWAMALARLQLEHGKVREAAETLGRHSPYADQNADYQAFHALVLQKQRRYAEAVQRYQAALALRPNESRWWYGMGISLESDQRPQEARAAFVKAKETGNLTPELAAAVEHRLR